MYVYKDADILKAFLQFAAGMYKQQQKQTVHVFVRNMSGPEVDVTIAGDDSTKLN